MQFEQTINITQCSNSAGKEFGEVRREQLPWVVSIPVDINNLKNRWILLKFIEFAKPYFEMWYIAFVTNFTYFLNTYQPNTIPLFISI